MRFMWILVACLAAGTSVAVADPLDVYVGAGLGYSTVQQSFVPVSVEEHPTGWKLFAGWRPIQMFGVEAEYVDLGSKDGSTISGGGGVLNSQRASASAVAAFLVGYLPQPLPFVDFYGKIGLASLQNNISNVATPNCGSCLIAFRNVTAVDNTRSRFAYGAGVQFKFGVPALRLEYQGISASGGDQSLLSLDLALNF